MEATAVKKGFNLMSFIVFNKLLSCTCGFTVKGRTVDTNEQETWMKGNILLCRLHDLEKSNT